MCLMLRLNNARCECSMSRLEFCGHVIDSLHKTGKKVEAVVNAANPENVSQLRVLSGLVNYCTTFLPDLATVLTT